MNLGQVGGAMQEPVPMVLVYQVDAECAVKSRVRGRKQRCRPDCPYLASGTRVPS